jgi:hypothetical protein
VTDRELQLERGGTWSEGKSADTSCRLGPWSVTQEEVGDSQPLRLRLWVKGILRQDDPTDRAPSYGSATGSSWRCRTSSASQSCGVVDAVAVPVTDP